MNRKNYVSVICEYNPFHFGHKFQLDSLKESFDGIICIMSGDIVQRGSVAVADKYIRAEAAINSGADLVLELPIPWCCSSARDFARAGVHIADAVGSSALAFGAEDKETVFELYRATQSEDFSDRLKQIVENNKNLSYPQAVTAALSEIVSASAVEAAKKPNNILSVEYLRALEGRDIIPFAVSRNSNFLSSSNIREGNGEKMLSMLPAESKAVFSKYLDTRFPRDIKALDSFFIGRLRQLDSLGTNSAFYSSPEGLTRKILHASAKASSVAELVSLCTDKAYTAARVRRAVNAIVFGIAPEQVSALPSYTCVLAANEKGCEILRSAKQKKAIDIVNKPIRAVSFGGETEKAFLFAKSVEDIISLSDPVPLPSDKAKNPIIAGK